MVWRGQCAVRKMLSVLIGLLQHARVYVAKISKRSNVISILLSARRRHSVLDYLSSLRRYQHVALQAATCNTALIIILLLYVGLALIKTNVNTFESISTENIF